MKKLILLLAFVLIAYSANAQNPYTGGTKDASVTLTTFVATPLVYVQGNGLAFFHVVKGDTRTFSTVGSDNEWSFTVSGQASHNVLVTFSGPTCLTGGAPLLSGKWVGLDDKELTSGFTKDLGEEGSFPIFYQLNSINATSATAAKYTFAMQVNWSYSGL